MVGGPLKVDVVEYLTEFVYSLGHEPTIR